MKKRIIKRRILEYNCVFQKEKEGGYSVWVPVLNGCASQGETFEVAQKNIKEAIELYLEDENDEIDFYSDLSDQVIAPVRVTVYA